MPIVTAAEASRFGYDMETVAPMLVRAETRVRTYLKGKASALSALQSPPDSLKELVLSVAHRMASTSSQVAQGVTSEQTGQKQVTFGSQAFAGTSDLTQPEKDALDSMFRSRPRSVDVLPTPALVCGHHDQQGRCLDEDGC
jgi:hypothetical protein